MVQGKVLEWRGQFYPVMFGQNWEYQMAAEPTEKLARQALRKVGCGRLPGGKVDCVQIDFIHKTEAILDA